MKRDHSEIQVTDTKQERGPGYVGWGPIVLLIPVWIFMFLFVAIDNRGCHSRDVKSTSVVDQKLTPPPMEPGLLGRWDDDRNFLFGDLQAVIEIWQRDVGYEMFIFSDGRVERHALSRVEDPNGRVMFFGKRDHRTPRFDAYHDYWEVTREGTLVLWHTWTDYSTPGWIKREEVRDRFPGE